MLYTLLGTFKKMEQEIKNKIKGLEESIKGLEESIKELVKELSSKKTLTEKSILKTYDCIVTERKMINNYKSFLGELRNILINKTKKNDTI